VLQVCKSINIQKDGVKRAVSEEKGFRVLRARQSNEEVGAGLKALDFARTIRNLFKKKLV